MAQTNSDSYDLVVIGGGAAGLTAAGLGASFGARTLLVEQDRLGGDCTWTGCIPSKTLLARAARFHQAHHVDEAAGSSFGDVMQTVRSTRRYVYEEADAPENLEAFGVEVQTGTASFLDGHRLRIEGERAREVRTRYVVIAAGGHPTAPPIDGLEEAGFYTSDTLFELEEQPERLAVIGAGPVGTEMAQAFRRLGTDVAVLEQRDRILGSDHPRLARRLQAMLEEEGVSYWLAADIERVEKRGRSTLIHFERKGEQQTLEVDAVLVAAGRRPNLEGLNLEAAGIECGAQGITVDDRCRTSQKHIFAAGDVTGRYQLTHMSEHMGKVAAMNALLRVPQSIDKGRVPWVTYTSPELAHVGATQRELDAKGASYATYHYPLERVDRAICEGTPAGEIRIYATKWTGRILGADILAPQAGEMIGLVAVAMKTGGTLRQLSDTIFPYPTYGLSVRRAADQWLAQKQRPWLVRMIQKVFGYSGPVIEPDPDRIV